jgi:ribosome-associated protein
MQWNKKLCNDVFMDSHLSRSEKKRRSKGIEQLVIELADLAQGEIASLPCGQEIRDEIASAKNLKGGARKRQLKYATKLLRDNKHVEELYDFLVRKKGSMLKEKRAFQELENYRNLLITEAVQLYEEQRHGNGYMNENEPTEFLHDSETLRAIVKHLPGVDQSLLKNTAMQFARTRNRKFSRELFRIMKAATERAQFSQQKDTNNGI